VAQVCEQPWRARFVCPADLPGVSLAIAQNSAAAQPRHVHYSLVLGVVTAGARRIATPDENVTVRTGEVFALAPGLAHACAPEGGPCSYLAFSIDDANLPERLPVRMPDAELASALSRLAEAAQEPAGSLERQSLLAEVLERLARHGLEPAERRRDGLADRKEDALREAVRQARELLETEHGPGLSLSGLAEACRTDMYALHRAFTRIVGLPPHAFQTHQRLRRAKELLRAGASPGEAALEAGFCDQSHLNRHFARLVGLTPAQYAKAHARQGEPPGP
jgi:methylphosphotriester-DNA--protein-cysteine methyltransferase